MKAMQGAEDDDSWMRDGAGELERELAAREKEMTGTQAASSGNEFDPDSLAQRFKVWISLLLCLFSTPTSCHRSSLVQKVLLRRYPAVVSCV